MAGPLAPRWIHPATGSREAGLRLFLFHHAGGAASTYREWGSLLPVDVAAQCVQLPGRQERRSEVRFTRMEPLVAALQEAVTDELDDRPYALFGHSMGAQLAFRLAVAMESEGCPIPVLIGAAAWAPVGFHPIPPEQAAWPATRLAGWARQLGSLPPEVCEDPEVLGLALPALRSDLEVIASSSDDGACVSCPVVTYGARSDPLMPISAMASWSNRTAVHLGTRAFAGGHFFVAGHAQAIVTDLTDVVRRCAEPAPR